MVQSSVRARGCLHLKKHDFLYYQEFFAENFSRYLTRQQTMITLKSIETATEKLKKKQTIKSTETIGCRLMEQNSE